MEAIVSIKNVVKDFGTKNSLNHVIKNISLDISDGDFVAIMGPSGSGKTTLLNMMSTLDKPTHGSIHINGTDVTTLDNKKLSVLRKDWIGFIFQDYNLLDSMSLEDNIALPLTLNHEDPKTIRKQVQEISSLFGLAEHLSKYPYQLSGGQKQRGASARALINHPKIIFADEPTGALDSKSSRDLMESLYYANRTYGTTIILVTHDTYCASYAQQVFMLRDGTIVGKINNHDNQEAFFEKISETVSSFGSQIL